MCGMHLVVENDCTHVFALEGGPLVYRIGCYTDRKQIVVALAKGPFKKVWHQIAKLWRETSSKPERP
jgi:hypothetical protein